MYISENIVFNVVVIILVSIGLVVAMLVVNDLAIDIYAHSKKGVKAKLFFALTVVNDIIFSLSCIGMFLFPVKKGLVSVPAIFLVISFLCYVVGFTIHLLKNRP